MKNCYSPYFTKLNIIKHVISLNNTLVRIEKNIFRNEPTFSFFFPFLFIIISRDRGGGGRTPPHTECCLLGSCNWRKCFSVLECKGVCEFCFCFVLFLIFIYINEYRFRKLFYGL